MCLYPLLVYLHRLVNNIPGSSKCVNIVPVHKNKTYQKAEILHILKTQVWLALLLQTLHGKKTCPKDPFVCSKKGMIYPIQSYDRKGWDIGPSILRILRLDELNKTNLQSDSHFFFLLRRGRWISHRDLHINWKREKTWNNGRRGPTCQFFIGIPVASQNLDRIHPSKRISSKIPLKTRDRFLALKNVALKTADRVVKQSKGFFRGSRLVWF